MKSSANYVIRVLTTGFIVLLLSAVVLFWGRFITEVRLLVGMPEGGMEVEILPSGLLPYAAENDPNVTRPSVAQAGVIGDGTLGCLGLVDYLMSEGPGGRRSDVVYFEDDGDWMYFDRATGQVVLRMTDEQARRVVTYYAGPDGVSVTPHSESGRFADPMIVRGWNASFVYDRTLRRFFSIDWQAQRVSKGPQLDPSEAVQPVRICTQQDEGAYSQMYVRWAAPMRLVPREKKTDDAPQQYESKYTMDFHVTEPSGRIPVVDASGRIDTLDAQTLELIPGGCYLPAPETLYGRGILRPKQLLSYGVIFVGVGQDAEYVGMVAGSVSRQGMSMTLAVYDESGKRVSRADSVVDLPAGARGRRAVPSARAALFEVPWGPALTIFKYSLESVHPPVLTIGSFFAATAVDARASHRALFLLPNSFVAMHRDHIEDGVTSQLFGALWTMFPAILLAVFLTWRVVRDAAVVGLSGATRAGWTIATLTFGLPAYITYRLTRPKAALVTCANCGQPRRPDMDRCHRCKSPWHVPELVPPTWTVLDGGVQIPSDADASEKEATETERNSDSSVESM